MTSLAVVGTGRIGGEVAYLATVLGYVDSLILHDTSHLLLGGQVLDIRHTGLNTEISTSWNRIRDADICIYSAGLARTPSVKTRADLLDVNLPAARESAQALAGFEGILITITNPADAINYYLHTSTGIAKERCIGFGGQLDSARYAIALRDRGIPGEATVIGEHGENQVPVFSNLPAAVPITDREDILAGLRSASMEVIRGKGGTVFGPAYHIASLIGMVKNDARCRTACSAVLDGEYGFSKCSLGVPVRIGREGILSIEEWVLDDWEQEKMEGAHEAVLRLCNRAVS
jgi:malate dehydrogenase